MRVAVYGGSFNPPHVGHAMVAAWVLWTDRADEVWLLPTFRHAFDKPLAPFDARKAWCEAMAGTIGAGVRVCTIEESLPSPSYTIDTLRALSSSHPDHTFRLVVGSDVLQQVDSWKDWSGIQRDFAPIIVGRAGYPNPPDVVVFPEVSSTSIRASLGRGEGVEAFVPAAVLEVLPAWRAEWS